MSKINYIGFARRGNTYGPAQGNGDYTPILPAGHYRVSYVEYNDELELTKFVPKMDDGVKKSAKGLLRVNEDLSLSQQVTPAEEKTGLLKTVYLNGKFTLDESLSTIRARLLSNL